MPPKKPPEDDAQSQVAAPFYLSCPAPTKEQIDMVRSSWACIMESKKPEDDSTTSPGHAFCLAFYAALFELDPDLRMLFSNVFQQARALAGMIAYIARVPSMTRSTSGIDPDICPAVVPIDDVNAFGRAMEESEARRHYYSGLVGQAQSVEPKDADEELIFLFRELGARHYFYNLQVRHLPLAGQSLLRALRERLGKECSPELEQAWQVAFDFVASHMKIGFEAQVKWMEGRRSSATASFFDRRKNTTCAIQ
ncbi:hypothetical protein EC973_000394 [Apophysomyces ossiformis]|uniref:Globin domain-containing protein n=1 Tax=Apophysomyces ossiformis TaxID=679940 RepID=A0A8H7EQ21_9FUNG|nr:hypothetical protein EC973_000394 [Apophysomyces ossiformis]